MDKATAKQILMTGNPPDQVAEANSVYYGTNGVYAQDLAKQAALTPPPNPPYAPPPSFTPPDIAVSYVAGLFDVREYMDQLNFHSYILLINGRNSAAFDAYRNNYANWRTQLVQNSVFVEPPVPPAFEVPSSYPTYKAWFDQSITGTATAPPETTMPLFPLPNAVPFDYHALLANIQAASKSVALGTVLAQPFPTSTP